MTPFRHLKSLDLGASGRFVTTYSHDYKNPFTYYQPQLKPRTKAKLQPTNYTADTSRKPPLTEYQARYCTEANREPQRKTDVLHQEDFLRSSSGEAGLQRLLKHPAASSSVITSCHNKDAEGLESRFNMWDLSSPFGLNCSSFIPPMSRQCIGCKTEPSFGCCFEIQTTPCGSTLPLAHVQPTNYAAETGMKQQPSYVLKLYTWEFGQPNLNTI